MQQPWAYSREKSYIRKIYDSERVDDDFRIRFNCELYELFNDIEVGQRINIQRLRWLSKRRFLMQVSTEVDVENDVECFARTKSRKLYHWLVWTKAEAPGWMCYSRLKSVTRNVNVILTVAGLDTVWSDC